MDFLDKWRSLPEEAKERLRREEEALAEAKAAPAEVDMIGPGVWVARRDGLVGVGPSAEIARLDLDRKTEMQLSRPMDPKVGELLDRIREAQEEAARRVYEQWRREQDGDPT